MSDLDQRLKCFAMVAVRIADGLPRCMGASVLGRQFLRSATSVGAHYREARRARSDAEFVAKLEVGIQELDEAAYWCDLLGESGYVPLETMKEVRREVDELLGILVSIVKKVKGRS